MRLLIIRVTIIYRKNDIIGTGDAIRPVILQLTVIIRW